jgi:hypothetical protein
MLNPDEIPVVPGLIIAAALWIIWCILVYRGGTR